MRVLTKMGNTLAPVIFAKGFEFDEKPVAYATVTTSKGDVTEVPVFDSCYIPEGFYKTTQSIPYHLFSSECAKIGARIKL